MNFDASKFYLGLMEFFSILLPGAALTFFLMPEAVPLLLPDAAARARIEGYGVALFLFASYLVGHLVFLLGAWWLDDVYDWARRHTLNAQIRDLASRGRLLVWPVRALVWMLFKREDSSAVRTATRLRVAQLAPFAPGNALNTFQWAKSWLAVEHSASLEAVQRFEADSKFFRSFVVVLLVLAILFALQMKWVLLIWTLVLIPLALWRYADQRLKATNQAYWSVITLHARAAGTRPAAKTPPADGITHAGGVLFRGRGSRTRYLLVEESHNPGYWVLPKGHREPGETLRETAVREVREECGVWARIAGELGAVTFGSGNDTVRTQFFLMRYAGRARPRDADRRHRWLTLEDACAAATYIETRELLRRADTHGGNS